MQTCEIRLSSRDLSFGQTFVASEPEEKLDIGGERNGNSVTKLKHSILVLVAVKHRVQNDEFRRGRDADGPRGVLRDVPAGVRPVPENAQVRPVPEPRRRISAQRSQALLPLAGLYVR